MTVIYTETHLITDPIIQVDIVKFDIALSSISVQCRIHREEIIKYIKENKVRKGDLVRIYGVFLTEIHPCELYYVNINSISLINHYSIGKKRKVDHLLTNDPVFWTDCIEIKEPESITSTTVSSPIPEDEQIKESSSNEYVEVVGDFSEYFFMLYGKVQYACQNVIMINQQQASTSIIKKQLELKQQESMNYLYQVLTQIYEIYLEIAQNGTSQLNVLNFVNLVTDLISKVNDLRKSSNHVMPPGLTMDLKVFLPTLIYQSYMMHYA